MLCIMLHYVYMLQKSSLLRRPFETEEKLSTHNDQTPSPNKKYDSIYVILTTFTFAVDVVTCLSIT